MLAANPVIVKGAWFGTTDATCVLALVVAFGLASRHRFVGAGIALAVFVAGMLLAVFAGGSVIATALHLVGSALVVLVLGQLVPRAKAWAKAIHERFETVPVSATAPAVVPEPDGVQKMF